MRLRRRPGRLSRLLWRGHDNRHRITELHHVIYQDLDIVSASDLEFDLAEERDIGGVQGNVLKSEFDFAFAQNGCLIGSYKADGLGEIADTRCPSVEKAELESDHGHLRHAQKIDHSD